MAGKVIESFSFLKIEIVAVGMYDSELHGLLWIYLKSIVSSEKSKYRIVQV